MLTLNNISEIEIQKDIGVTVSQSVETSHTNQSKVS